MPKISIIVPVYNTEKYISRCIESILKQTFKDFELILINDGSKDRSAEICNFYSKKDSRVRVFHNDNRGVSYSRNYGISMSNGKYIMFCDSDDYVAKDWCEELYKTILKYPNSWISCCAYTINNESKKMEGIENFTEKITYLDKSDYWISVRRGTSGACWNKIFRKDLIDKFNIKFNENHELGEDVEFTIDYLKECDSIVLVNKYLYYYIMYKKEIFAFKDPEEFFSLVIFFYNLRKPYIKEIYLEEFYKEYFHSFSYALNNNINSKKNKLLRKLKYNQNAINTNEFIECLENVDKNSEERKYIKLLKTHNYYVVYMFQQLHNFKQYLLNKIKNN